MAKRPAPTPPVPDDGSAPATTAHIATVRDMALGNADAIIALAITLANAGLIRRKDFAEQLAYGLDQQRQRDGDTRPAARRTLEIVHAFFSAPVWGGERPN